mmetsp:Transcript_18830/g.45142  ORF Transcript_18830/g.45142 Transcript_18830/m.45142 type:complete len:213 (-) Transcript_18830:211-849(-)
MTAAQAAHLLSEAGEQTGPMLLRPRERQMLRLGYPLLIGLLASWTVLLLKGSGEVFKTATSGDGEDLLRWKTYIFPFGLVLTLPTQLLFINKALRHFEALYVVPALQCFWSTSSIVMGGIFFQEFDHYKPWELACFCCGCALCVLGLYILSTSSEGEASFYRSGELLVENGREQCLLRASHMRRAASERQTDAMARIPASEEQREPNYIAGR